MFSKQFPIKRTNSHGHTTITAGANLFCQKSSFHFPKKKTSFKGGPPLFTESFQNMRFFGKLSQNFKYTYFSGFSRYNSDQVIKKHLLDQENWLARTRRARARLRARKPRSRPVILEKSRKLFKLWVTYFGAQRARNRARAHLVHANRLSWSWRWFLTTWSLA